VTLLTLQSRIQVYIADHQQCAKGGHYNAGLNYRAHRKPELAYEFFRVLHQEWRAAWHQNDATRFVRTFFGWVVAAIAISLATNVIWSAPNEAVAHNPVHHVLNNGLHIAVPDVLRAFPIEQVIPLP
jgi:hypothetical protein